MIFFMGYMKVKHWLSRRLIKIFGSKTFAYSNFKPNVPTKFQKLLQRLLNHSP